MVTPRERARKRTVVEIRELAWRQVEQVGAQALSLRAIARELGVVSSAIYRYVPSRDDLLTGLLVDGFNDLADAVIAAEAAVPRAAHRERWLTICRAMRAWALDRPSAWGLLYGGPVPGYAAPEEITPPGTRVLLRHAAVMLEAMAAGELRPRIGPAAGLGELQPELRGGLEAVAAEYEIAAGADVIALGLLGWTAVLGAISTEVFRQLGVDPSGSPEAFAEVQFASIADALGL